ncbi:DUF1996 domain-containing protein [Thalassotalea ganghwensis]
MLNIIKPLPASMLLLIVSGCGGGNDATALSESEQFQNENTVLKPEFIITPLNSTQDTFAYFEFESTTSNNFECQANQQAIIDCTSGITVIFNELGEQNFSVWAIAENGQRSEASTFTWTIKSIFDGDKPHQDLIETQVLPSQADANSWRGIFRINCDFSHLSYNDPIVYPGQEDVAHLHRFYGNTLVDHDTTMESLYSTGESSCQGGALNRSSYWVPALLAPVFDSSTGEKIYDEDGQQRWQVVPAVVGNDDEAHEIFYYSAGIDDIEAIQPIPAGLRMIAGDHMAQPGAEQDLSVVRWHCQSWESNDATNPRFSASIPECVAPDRVRMDIFFPSCWNGVDLDSSDHKSHMAYPVNNGGPNGTVCPSSHPVAIVRPSYHYAFGVKPEVYDPATKASKGWRLASDRYEVGFGFQGGMSLHGDWFNGWHPEAMQALLDNCVKGQLDCHDGNLANGYRLSGTQPGSQLEPLIINGGMGGN